MLNKKLMLLSIFIVSLLAVSIVSAADDTTGDIVSLEESNSDEITLEKDNPVILKENDANETLSYENDNVLGSNSNVEVLGEYISYAQITTNTITGYAGDYITLKATVKNDQGIAKKATVEFYFNGQTYTTTTDSYGVARVTVKCPPTSVWDTSTTIRGNIITKTTIYMEYYTCDVTAYGTDYYKNTDSFYVISKKSTVVKKYKIIKKKKVRTVKVRSGVREYRWGNYGLGTYKHSGGYGTVLETAMAKKNYGFIKFYVSHHYKKNGKWKWSKWRKVPKDYTYEFSYGRLIKCDKIKVKYTQVSYRRI